MTARSCVGEVQLLFDPVETGRMVILAWDDLPEALKEYRQIADQLKDAIGRVLEL